MTAQDVDSGSESVRKRGRPRNPETDRSILRAGFELFCERGVEGSSIEQIARRAGVGKLTVYRRWSSKEELLAAAIEQEVEDQGVWPTPDELAAISTESLLTKLIPAAADAAARPEYRAMIARVFGSAVSNPEVFLAYWNRYLLPRREASLIMLRRAQDDGVINAEVDLEVLLDMLAGAVVYRVLQPEPPNARQLRQYLTTLYRSVGLL